jgi:hypothetical protein
MRAGFSHTEVLAMSETEFMKYLDVAYPNTAGDSAGGKRFTRPKKPGPKKK